MDFRKSYKYKDTEYRFDDNGICLGVFVNNKYSDDAKRGFIPKGTKITKENEKRMIEIGGFEPQGIEHEDGEIDEKKELENKKENPKWGGARPNSGRPKGGENKATKEKRIVKEEMKQRIMRSKDSLLNSQMNLAKGVQMLFKSKKLTIEDKEGNVIEIKKEKPVLVESQSEIESYLAGEYDDDKDNYYFITIEKPDNKAIDSMFDRAFDKARQNVGLDGGEDKPISLEFRKGAKEAIKELLDENSNDSTKQ